MSRNALRQRLAGDLCQGRVQGAYELGSRRSEIGGFASFVVPHDGQPVRHGSEVAGGWGLALLKALDGTAGDHDYAEARWAADGLLAGGKHDVEVPRIKGKLLGADAADAIDDDQRIWADAAGQGSDRLDICEDAGGGVDVGDGKEFVGFCSQGFLNLVEGGLFANGCLELGDFSTVGFKAVGKGIAKVAGVQDEGFFFALDQVRGYKVPAQCATAGDEERLGGWGCSLEEAA